MRLKVLLSLLIGIVIGLVLSVVLPEPKRDRYVLLRDLDIQQSYFFDKAKAPVQGVVKAGSEFEVDWRYSQADYIVFRTVVDREQLMAMSKPAPSETGKHKK